jgi:type II secretory pathway component PulF
VFVVRLSSRDRTGPVLSNVLQMHHDEFAFFNHQLAAMLRDGIPLEGALRQLAQGMRDRKLRAELETIEAELPKGTPLPRALERSSLPEFYRRMLEIGARSNDLPATLTLLADHYQRSNAIWMRLKGLLVYPVLVIIVSLALTFVITSVLSRFMSEMGPEMGGVSPVLLSSIWFAPVLLALLAFAVACAITIASLRSRLRWRLPAFREASLAQLASAMALMLRNGLTLSEALALAQMLESNSPASRALAEWQTLVASGQGKPGLWQKPPQPFPPFFLWLIQQSGEDLAGGFEKAAEVYQARAGYRVELALYGALPLSILLLGQMVLWQIVPVVQTMANFLNMLCDVGGL